MRILNIISRRSFLVTLGWLIPFGFMRPVHALAKLRELSRPDPLTLKLAEIFIHKDSAKIVGQAYLQSFPGEADIHFLVDLICPFQAARQSEIIKTDGMKLRELLFLQQCQDFEYGRVVKVQGWILSQTEARLCALVALL